MIAKTAYEMQDRDWSSDVCSSDLIDAYDVEFQEWIDGVRDGGTFGPSSWDGYAAAVVSEAAVESLLTGTRSTVRVGDKPALYA